MKTAYFIVILSLTIAVQLTFSQTLDQAYDFGGAGRGRTITADAGAVLIQGPNGLIVNGKVGIGIMPHITYPRQQLYVISPTLLSGEGIFTAANTDKDGDAVAISGIIGSWGSQVGTGGPTSILGVVHSPNPHAKAIYGWTPNYASQYAGYFAGRAWFGGNVGIGIGAQEPKEKLHVDGCLVVEDSIGVGTTNPEKRLDVRTKKTNDTACLFVNDGNFGPQNSETGAFVSVSTNNSRGMIVLGSGAYVNGNKIKPPELTNPDTLMLLHTTGGWQFKAPQQQNFNFCLGEKGNVGIGLFNPSYRLDVAGYVGASGFWTISDPRFKTDIKPLNDVLQRLLKLKGISFLPLRRYVYIDNMCCYKKVSLIPQPLQEREFGLNAEEVEKLFPEAVDTRGEENFKAIDYSKLTVVLIEAIKELKTENEKLAQRIEKLEKRKK